MMGPRSYHYIGASSRSPSPSRRRKVSPTRPVKPLATAKSNSPTQRLATPRKLSVISPATPSEPVVIPTRLQSSKPNRGSSLQERRNLENDVWTHESDAITPSMAALLAISSLPPTKAAELRRRGRTKGTDMDSLNMGDFRHSVSSSSPKSWSILQDSADDYDDDDDARTEKSTDAETDASSLRSSNAVAAPSSWRSFSCESTPSLDIDLDDESTRSISPPTPAQRPRFRARSDRMLAPAVAIPSDGEHPLATASFPDSPEPSPPPTPVASKPTDLKLFASQSTTTSTSFKSNLTASLRLLKSAATVLSAPTRLHDPTALTIQVLPGSSTDGHGKPQLRPTSSEGPNLHVRGNIDALPLHLSAQLPGPLPTMSIQLQHCQPSPLTTATASAPPIFLGSHNAADANFEKPFQREPRENSDFLRVVVLEMNMRRAGKLTGEGRARLWLSARQEVKLNASGRVTAGIADGGEGHGAVVLDGELGEAQEVEVELEHQQHQTLHHFQRTPERQHCRPTIGRAHRVPRRWLPLSA